MYNPWLPLAIKTLQLGFDAQQVVFLRIMRLWPGDARGQAEARRMIADKIAAAMEAQAVTASAVMAGRSGAGTAVRIVERVAKRVRSNKRRLSR